eukprot:6487233-Amphidinium_carterae.1
MRLASSHVSSHESSVCKDSAVVLVDSGRRTDAIVLLETLPRDTAASWFPNGIRQHAASRGA